MRTGTVALFVALAAFAGANAAMGYALEQYDARAWWAYVGATVVFEAWAIGRWAGFGWLRAVGVSVLANLVTAFCCANLCGVGLHQSFVGSRLNPNPFLNMLVMFTVFGALSGWIESAVWRLCGAKKDDNSTALRSIGMHLAWVPFGMAIMLVPARPYPMLEGYTRYARRGYIERTGRALEAQIAESGRVPAFRDSMEFFRKVRPLDDERATPDDWAVPYRPDFGRFATGQTKGAPMFEWNVRANGLRWESLGETDRIWLLRSIPIDEDRYGLFLDPRGVHSARNDFTLDGTTATPAPSAPARKAPPTAVRSRPRG